MIVPTPQRPLAFGLGVVNACPRCFGVLEFPVGEWGEPDALGVCSHCGEAFTHRPHAPGGRICARMPRAWFVEHVTVAARDNVPHDPLIPGDKADFSTEIFRVKGADLGA